MASRESRLHDVMRTAFYSLWGVLTLILLFTVGFLVVQLTQNNELTEMTPTNSVNVPITGDSSSASANGRTVTLYFAAPSAVKLVPEDRALPLSENTVENCRRAFAALAEGPRSDAYPVMPVSATTRALYLLPTGELVVDLARDVESPQTQSASAEWLLIQSIVHTLTQPAVQGTNDRPVTTVRLLFEGSPMNESFPSHIALQDALRPNPQLLGGE